MTILNDQDKTILRKLHTNLMEISQTGRAHINLTLYKKMGLIKVFNRKIQNAQGNIEMVFDRLVLTEKAKCIMANLMRPTNITGDLT